MQQPAGREAVAQAADQFVGALALGRADRVGRPFRAVHVVDRDEGRLAAHGQPHVAGGEFGIDRLAQRVDLGPLAGRVGLGDARVLVDALDRHLEAEGDARRLDQAADRRGVLGIGGGGERDMALAGQEARSRVEPDPAGAGDIDLAPGVQVGEILFRARRAVERLHVGLELD